MPEELRDDARGGITNTELILAFPAADTDALPCYLYSYLPVRPAHSHATPRYVY